MNIAIILAGGQGIRARQKFPKQFVEVKGKPLIVYTLEKFQQCDLIDQICVVCAEEYINLVTQYKNLYNITKLMQISKGGDTGLQSLYNGYFSLDGLNSDDLILIHDAVRPFISVNLIKDNINCAKKYGVAMTAVDCVETLAVTDDGLSAKKFIPRDGIKRIQTPQTFSSENLLKIFKNVDLTANNEPSIFILWMQMGNPIYCSRGSEKNIKITYPEDVEYFKNMFEL